MPLSIDSLGRQQLTIMETLWTLGEATVHDVRERLAAKRPLAYTTVLSTLQKLEKTGWVRHRAVGRNYLYRAACSRAAAGARSLKTLLSRAFQGDALLMFEALLDSTPVTDSELARIRELIASRRKEPRRD